MRPRLIRRRPVYRSRNFILVRDVLQMGKRRIERDTILHPGAVVIIPVLSDQRLVFVRQYRRAVDRMLLELPAGTLEPGEGKQACARRELEEETGWRAKHWKRVGAFFAAPGVSSEEMTLFLATGLTEAVACPEPDELLKPVILSLPEALAKVRSGVICDAKTIIGVFLASELLNGSKKTD
ncbi:MAG: NUDIX hydrolase [Candidatus Omnitrophica bacterium]|nr:NUDIX hydrolase [Candidatus Omnitrophota bacterium]